VNRFHTIAPTRPASRIINKADPPLAVNSGFGAPLLSWILITALVTVSATSTDRNAPMRFKIADRATAVLGFNAPVAMDVAIAFAVSWKPFVKSNAKAVVTTRIRMRVALDTRR